MHVDEAAPQDAEGNAAWSANLDTTAYADGSHLITVTATDMAGNVGAASVTVLVRNEPPPPPPPEDPPPPPPEDPPPPPPSSGTPVAPPAPEPGAIGGYVFQEIDRDGVYETDEQPLVNKRVYLYAESGTYLANASTDAAGWYQFTGLADTTYRVAYDTVAWWDLWRDWAPSTTGSERPRVEVNLSSWRRVDFGWRPSSVPPTSTRPFRVSQRRTVSGSKALTTSSARPTSTTLSQRGP